MSCDPLSGYLIVQTLAGFFFWVIVAGNPEAIQTPAQTKARCFPGEDHPLQPTYAKTMMKAGRLIRLGTFTWILHV